ncbi:hypothetical protein L3V82_04515 [Thiotrichales bacterium 19S3-7]|nr:hypothetical protein [Thiotrichales bacterium 19S3-7]MCF6801359.1 hypothetical protein [Thiotrichales bacterium 19S3-11]
MPSGQLTDKLKTKSIQSVTDLDENEKEDLKNNLYRADAEYNNNLQKSKQQFIQLIDELKKTAPVTIHQKLEDLKTTIGNIKHKASDNNTTDHLIIGFMKTLKQEFECLFIKHLNKLNELNANAINSINSLTLNLCEEGALINAKSMVNIIINGGKNTGLNTHLISAKETVIKQLATGYLKYLNYPSDLANEIHLTNRLYNAVCEAYGLAQINKDDRYGGGLTESQLSGFNTYVSQHLSPELVVDYLVSEHSDILQINKADGTEAFNQIYSDILNDVTDTQTKNRLNMSLREIFSSNKDNDEDKKLMLVYLLENSGYFENCTIKISISANKNLYMYDKRLSVLETIEDEYDMKTLKVRNLNQNDLMNSDQTINEDPCKKIANLVTPYNIEKILENIDGNALTILNDYINPKHKQFHDEIIRINCIKDLIGTLNLKLDEDKKYILENLDYNQLNDNYIYNVLKKNGLSTRDNLLFLFNTLNQTRQSQIPNNSLEAISNLFSMFEQYEIVMDEKKFQDILENAIRWGTIITTYRNAANSLKTTPDEVLKQLISCDLKNFISNYDSIIAIQEAQRQGHKPISVQIVRALFVAAISTNYDNKNVEKYLTIFEKLNNSDMLCKKNIDLIINNSNSFTDSNTDKFIEIFKSLKKVLDAIEGKGEKGLGADRYQKFTRCRPQYQESVMEAVVEYLFSTDKNKHTTLSTKLTNLQTEFLNNTGLSEDRSLTSKFRRSFMHSVVDPVTTRISDHTPFYEYTNSARMIYENTNSIVSLCPDHRP